MLIVDIVDGVIPDMDLMNAYGFILDLRHNVLTDGQKNIKFSMTWMTGSAYHSIKQVIMAEEEVTYVENINLWC